MIEEWPEARATGFMTLVLAFIILSSLSLVAPKAVARWLFSKPGLHACDTHGALYSRQSS